MAQRSSGSYPYTTTTRGNGNCTPVNTGQAPTFTPSNVGEYAYSATNQATGGTSGVGVQYCNMSGPYNSIGMTIYALQCKPEWNLDSNDHHYRIDTSGPIDIYLPTSMSFMQSALDAAVADWENYTGFDFDITLTNATCISNRCINIELSDDLPNFCGFTPGGPSDPTTGLRVEPSILQLNGLTVFTDEALKRTFAHELGHLLGMKDSPDSPACGVSDTVMQRQYYCDQTGVMDDVTFSDYKPVVNTVYGTGSRLTCGF